jgi:phosphoglycerol transferase MdoB-like AlkP superfamily enzyme
MASFFRSKIPARFLPLYVTVSLVTGISFITRLILLIWSWKNLEIGLLTLPAVFLIGFLYDLVVSAFFCIPVALYIWLMKDRWYQSKWNRLPLFGLFFLITFILVLNAGSEITFWNEFSVRFNFIAVDYLVYTNEVIGNIFQSYNMPLILGGVVVVTLFLVWYYRRQLMASQQVSMRFGKRTLWMLGTLAVAGFGYLISNNQYRKFSHNNYVNELAGNGLFEFGSAFWHNEIDYPQFYPVADMNKNVRLLREQFQAPGVRFVDDGLNITRQITADSAARNWNIVLISVESLSGDYLRFFGGKDGITPYLDSLIPHSLCFSNFYASGTRTVRGLEALSLAIPPTPGQSIVRRPGNEDMFSMGNVLRSKGYDVRYVYGGNSFFDNMGYFFSHNGYDVIDQRDIPEDAIHHETVWGVADEDALDRLLSECDASHAKGKLFFNHLMTVSNHRPYTYPEGRIDISPNEHSWMGAVKYTDYSINRFLKQAQQKPWFNQTIFVIVADHCSASAGKTDLPVTRYHIPCLIYAPALIQPKIETRLTSQIDLAPTLLGLLNQSYQSKFMGFDLYHTPVGRERIFISTYQDMGYVKGDTLVILSPQKKVAVFKTDFNTGLSKPISSNPSLVAEAIAWYQSASYFFTEKKYRFP